MERENWVEFKGLLYSKRPNVTGRYIEGKYESWTWTSARFRILRSLTFEQLPLEVQGQVKKVQAKVD